MLGIRLIPEIGIHRSQVILSVDLHSMTRKEEKRHVTIRKGRSEFLEGVVHLLMRTIRLLNHRKAARRQFGGYVGSVISRVAEFIDLRIGRVANHEGRQAFWHVMYPPAGRSGLTFVSNHANMIVGCIFRPRPTESLSARLTVS